MRNDLFLKEMGKKIKAIRQERNITLRQLGRLCQLDYGSICRIEGGQIDSHILTLKTISYQLQVDIKEFF